MFRTLEEQKTTTKIEKYPAKSFRVFSKIRLKQIEIKLKQELKYFFLYLYKKKTNH